jgi:hypothetical protein
VVGDVLDGTADAGFLLTSIIETMEVRGRARERWR